MSTTRGGDRSGIFWAAALVLGCCCLTAILVIGIVVLVKVNRIEDDVESTIGGLAVATQPPFLSRQALNPLNNRLKTTGLEHKNAVRSVLDVKSVLPVAAKGAAAKEQAMPALVEAKGEQKRSAPNQAAPHLSKGVPSLAQRAREANKL